MVWCAAIAALSVLSAQGLVTFRGDLDEMVSVPYGRAVRDRRGEVLTWLPGYEGSRMRYLTLPEIPLMVRRVFQAAEDGGFYSHRGVSLTAVARAGWQFLRTRDLVSGASTIDMQVARILWPPRDDVPRLWGKAREMVLALVLDLCLTKNEILETYLNYLPFGYNRRGVEAAAWRYFGVSVGELSASQTLLLACVPRNPTLYDPEAHPLEALRAAADLAGVLGLAPEPGGPGAALATGTPGTDGVQASHFLRLLKDHFASREGSFTATLDLEVQEMARTRVNKALDRYADQRVGNAAVLALDNRSGEVLAWVGSRDFGDPGTLGQIDGVMIRSSSGSAIKPLLYACALERGFTAATLLPDAKIRFGRPEAYVPVNFDRRFRGVVRLRTALASSLNIPAVYLLSQLGEEEFVEYLDRSGFDLPASANGGLGLALGNAPVTLLELTRAFAALASGGSLPPISIWRDGGSILPPLRVCSPETAWIITDILSDSSARSIGFGTESHFDTEFPGVFKSGTSSEHTHLWCLAATPRYTVGVWAGNFDGTASLGATGSTVAARVAREVLEFLASREGVSPDWRRPDTIASVEVCGLTGESSLEACPVTRTEYFRSGTPLPGLCRVHGRGEAGKVDREELLQEVLADSKAPRIMHPVHGQIITFDGGEAADTQAVLVWIAAPADAAVEISVDGGQPRAMAYPFETFVPVRTGVHEVRVRIRSAAGNVSPRPATPRPATPRPATPRPATPRPATPRPATTDHVVFTVR